LPRQRALLAGSIVALALALAAIAWVQVRQYRLLDAVAQYEDDYLQVSMHELQTEQLRLHAAVRAARADGLRSRDNLQLRYDVFVSRVDLLAGPRAARLLNVQHELEAARTQAQAFVVRADRLLGPAPSEVLNDASLQRLDAEMAALDPPIHSLALEAAHLVSAQQTLRDASLGNYNRVSLALTGLLVLASFGFGMLALGQLRRLDERRRTLEHLTAALRQSQHDAESANRAKSVFLANMSHEIRTPFQGMLGMLQLLDTSPLTGSQRAQLHTARDSAQHLLTILNDLLDMAKLEAGTLSVESQQVALRDVIGDVQQLMQGQAAAKGLALQVSVAAALPEQVLIDGTRVRQVLYNLLSNAIKFTDKGGITLDVRNSGAEIVFAVVDTGIGIDAATLPRLFQRFGQADGSRARRHGGTGLGLEISRNLARLMGGDLTVQSSPGQGSRFEMRLPLRASPAGAAAGAPAAAAAPAAVAARKLRVLAAEDNPVNREVLAAMIEHEGHAVTFAEDGVQAVRAMGSWAFDLVLMDLHMPELDGIGATRAIRALGGAAAKVPIIALTADAFAETRQRCLEAGMNDFVTKPVGLADLTAMLTRYAVARP